MARFKIPIGNEFELVLRVTLSDGSEIPADTLNNIQVRVCGRFYDKIFKHYTDGSNIVVPFHKNMECGMYDIHVTADCSGKAVAAHYPCLIDFVPFGVVPEIKKATTKFPTLIAPDSEVKELKEQLAEAIETANNTKQEYAAARDNLVEEAALIREINDKLYPPVTLVSETSIVPTALIKTSEAIAKAYIPSYTTLGDNHLYVLDLVDETLPAGRNALVSMAYKQPFNIKSSASSSKDTIVTMGIAVVKRAPDYSAEARDFMPIGSGEVRVEAGAHYVLKKYDVTALYNQEKLQEILSNTL